MRIKSRSLCKSKYLPEEVTASAKVRRKAIHLSTCTALSTTGKDYKRAVCHAQEEPYLW